MSVTTVHAQTVAAQVGAHIDAISWRRSQKEIARMIGMSATMLSMVRTGRNKLPIDYVAKLATAIEIDPRRLLRLVLNEGMAPAAVAVLTDLLGPLVTRNELEIIEVVRAASGNTDPAVSEHLKAALNELFGPP